MVMIRTDTLPPESYSSPADWPEKDRCSMAHQMAYRTSLELGSDVERYLRFVEQAEELEVWRWANYDSFEAYIESCDLTLEIIGDYRSAVSRLKQGGHDDSPITQAAIDNLPPLPANGVRGKARDKSFDNIKANQGGTNATYTARRLKRDNPEILQRVIDGELSLNQAAIEAGFREKTISIPFDPHKAGLAIKRKYTAQQIDTLMAAMIS